METTRDVCWGKRIFPQAVTKFGQSASYFALQNNCRLLAALDTSYSEHDLHGRQAQWLANLVKGAGDRKVLLFSHHQPFTLFPSHFPSSLFDQGVVKKLSSLLRSRRITAWYWGHEHRCSLYEPHEVWGFHGRCVGHGGFPEFRDKRVFTEKVPEKPKLQRFFSRNFVPGGRAELSRSRTIGRPCGAMR
jgi:hypothetical protein